MQSSQTLHECNKQFHSEDLARALIGCSLTWQENDLLGITRPCSTHPASTAPMPLSVKTSGMGMRISTTEDGKVHCTPRTAVSTWNSLCPRKTAPLVLTRTSRMPCPCGTPPCPLIREHLQRKQTPDFINGLSPIRPEKENQKAGIAEHRRPNVLVLLSQQRCWAFLFLSFFFVFSLSDVFF